MQQCVLMVLQLRGVVLKELQEGEDGNKQSPRRFKSALSEQKYQAVNPFIIILCVATRFPGKRGRRLVRMQVNGEMSEAGLGQYLCRNTTAVLLSLGQSPRHPEVP